VNLSSIELSIQRLHIFANTLRFMTCSGDILDSTGDRTMLVRSCPVGDSVQIAPDITITVLHVRGDQVRLRVTTPPDLGVYREEVVSELSSAAIRALSSGDVTLL
jgi:carbon storage regulator CsrA